MFVKLLMCSIPMQTSLLRTFSFRFLSRNLKGMSSVSWKHFAAIGFLSVSERAMMMQKVSRRCQMSQNALKSSGWHWQTTKSSLKNGR